MYRLFNLLNTTYCYSILLSRWKIGANRATAGGIVSPANPGYTVEELAFQLKDAGAKALATQKPLLDIAIKAAKQVGIPEDRIILLGDERDETMKFKHFLSIKNLAGTSRYRRAKINPKDDLAFLVYSSGTTGHPKVFL